jgi:hypothetical protein
MINPVVIPEPRFALAVKRPLSQGLNRVIGSVLSHSIDCW